MDQHEDPWRGGSMWQQRSWHQIERDIWKAPCALSVLTAFKRLTRIILHCLPTRGVAVQYED